MAPPQVSGSCGEFGVSVVSGMLIRNKTVRRDVMACFAEKMVTDVVSSCNLKTLAREDYPLIKGGKNVSVSFCIDTVFSLQGL
jgi:hypothetical protein